MSKARIATGTIGALGIALLVWVLGQWEDPEHWVLWTGGLVSVALILLTVFWPMFGGAAADEHPSVGGNVAKAELNEGRVGGDVTNVGGNQYVGLDVKPIHHAENVVINYFEGGAEARIQAPEDTDPSSGAFIDFRPSDLFATGDAASIGAVANVSAVSSFTSTESTDLSFTFTHPMRDTSYEVTPVGGGIPNFTLSDVKKDALTISFDGDMPEKLTIRIQEIANKDKE